MAKDEIYTIDVDLIIRKYNEDNPDLRKLDRKILAEKLGVNKQIFTEWKTKAPKAVKLLFSLMDIGDCQIEFFVKPKS